eukprot:Clim_evm20s243 gene=Clim_evmTU20s243
MDGNVTAYVASSRELLGQDVETNGADKMNPHLSFALHPAIDSLPVDTVIPWNEFKTVPEKGKTYLLGGYLLGHIPVWEMGAENHFGMHLVLENACSCWYYPKETLELPPLPAGVYVMRLRPIHAPLVNRLWEFGSQQTAQFVHDILSTFPAFGVFLSENDTESPVAWCICMPYYALGMVKCLSEHRRKGYAAIAIQYTMKAMMDLGVVPFCYIVDGNAASEGLFSKLGYTKQNDVHGWWTMRPAGA